MTIETFIDGLSREEQLIAMELLWSRLSRDPSEQPPAWHHDVVAERIAKLNNGGLELVNWDEAKKRLSDRAK